MERVVVLGNSGGGKSVLARQLAERFKLPYTEIDSLLWLSGWRLAPAATYETAHSNLIARDRWLIDGLGVRQSIPRRLALATDIILIDMPLWTHFWLAAERHAAWAAGRLDHPPAGIPDPPPMRELFKTIWDVDREWMPEIRRLIALEGVNGKRIFAIESAEELGNFMARPDLAKASD